MKKSWIVILLPAILACGAQRSFDGTWKIDLAKEPLLKMLDRPRIMVLQNGTYQCLSCNPEYKIKADGTDYPIPGSKGVSTVAVRAVDSETIEMTTKRGGKVSVLEIITVSEDGRMRIKETIYTAGKEPQIVESTSGRIAAGPAGSHVISGTWRLQTAISTALVCKSSPDGLMIKAFGESYEAKLDGKDYPVKGSDASRTVSLKRVNDRSIDMIIKHNGRIVRLNHMTLSGDGKALTVKAETGEKYGSRSLTLFKR